MSIAYTLRESISGFRRAKLSALISIVTVCIALLLLGIFVVVAQHTAKFVDALRSKVEMEAFLEQPVAAAEIEAIRKQVAAIDGVDSVQFVSKEEAARIFKREFGEDVSTILDFNPFPPSFKITLVDGHRTAERAADVERRLAAIRGVESVKYWRELLEILDRRTRTFHSLTLGLGILIGLSAIFLVSNTIRLAIYAKRRLIRTMELVGATSLFIRAPFFLEGMLQGLLGGLLAAGIFWVLLEQGTRLLSPELWEFVRIPPEFYIAVTTAGVFLGIVGSIIAVVRFIGPARER
jgi:cell division transport system permease protein